jgi:hypothetical protein
MSKPGKFVIPLLVATPLILLLAQCSYGDLRPIPIGKKIWLKGDKVLFQQEVRRQILIGSSIADARNILELNSFKCAATKEAKPGESSKTDKAHGDTDDRLYCDLNVSGILFLTTYSSSIYSKNGIVTEVDASFSSMWP